MSTGCRVPLKFIGAYVLEVKALNPTLPHMLVGEVSNDLKFHRTEEPLIHSFSYLQRHIFMFYDPALFAF